MASFEPDERLGSLFAFVPLDATAKRDLCARMSGADRHYHGIDHLALLWDRHERYGGAAGLRTAEIDLRIACAIAYHDAVYAAGRSDNEEKSADLWLDTTGSGRIDDDARTWVADTIRATSNHLAYAPGLREAGRDVPAAERARLWLLDLDLTPLGEAPDVFDANTELLRAESPDVPEAVFEQKRLQFLRSFETAPAIFRSPVLAAAFEDRARDNIRRQLASVNAW